LDDLAGPARSRQVDGQAVADNGGTAHQIRAFGGWTTLAQVEKYTRKSNDVRLNSEAVRLEGGRRKG